MPLSIDDARRLPDVHRGNFDIEVNDKNVLFPFLTCSIDLPIWEGSQIGQFVAYVDNKFKIIDELGCTRYKGQVNYYDLNGTKLFEVHFRNLVALKSSIKLQTNTEKQVAFITWQANMEIVKVTNLSR